MRITIPATMVHLLGGTGFQTTFPLSGDFEVTLAFEILQLDTPPSGFGVGVGIRLPAPAGDPGEIMIARFIRPMDREIILWQRGQQNGRILVSDKIGRLRLTRSGKLLRYLWASGLSGEAFEVINQIAIGTGDIRHVRLVAMTNQKPCNLDIRLLDFRVRQSDQKGVSGPSDTESAPVEPVIERRFFRPIWLVAGFLLLLLLLAGGLLRLRHANRKD